MYIYGFAFVCLHAFISFNFLTLQIFETGLFAALDGLVVVHMLPPIVNLSGFLNEIRSIFAAACTWQKYIDPAALGGVTSAYTGEGEFKGGTCPLFNKKRPASFPRDKALANTLRYHSSCRPFAGDSPSRPPSRAGALSGTKRPRLLARSPSEHEMFRKCRRAMGTPARPMEDSTRVPRYQIATMFRFERILRSRRLSAGGSQGIFAAAPGRLPPSGGSLCRGIAGYSS